MIRTHIFPCSLAKAEADALNRESGRVYTATLVEHYRVYRHTGNWLSPGGDEKLSDHITGDTILHAHSRDAAQQGFPKAVKTAIACQKLGLNNRYPHKCKSWRTTVWKVSGMKVENGALRLAKARGLKPLWVPLPPHLASTTQAQLAEIRLVWDRAARHYAWHLVLDDNLRPVDPPGTEVAGIDLGEIHPAAGCDGEESVVFSARQLRSLAQYTNKRLASIQAKQSTKKKSSWRWKRLQRRKNRFLAYQERRRRDILHKTSCAVVDWAVERKIGTLTIGDVRDAAGQVALGKIANQKISAWPHGQLRKYIEYKANNRGIDTRLVNEAYTSQTCPVCRTRHKPKGRIFACPACGFRAHRDAIGAVNIRSVFLFGTPGKVLSPPPKYRHPFWILRSRLDTAHVARPQSREAARL